MSRITAAGFSALLLPLLVACSSDNPNLFGNGAGGGDSAAEGGTGQGTGDSATGTGVTGTAATGTAATGTAAAGTGGASTGGTASNGPGPNGSASTGVEPCSSASNEDSDQDGWTGANGDCNDCDPLVNPGAAEISTEPGQIPVDENCNGQTDEGAAGCDAGLGLSNVDALSAARAIDLCQSAEGPQSWGLLDAAYVSASGAEVDPDLSAGILDGFGPAVLPLRGSRLLALSSGHARLPTDPDACTNESCATTGLGAAPPGFPQAAAGCTPSADVYDDIGLQVRLRAPSNATGYTYRFKFYSFEYPSYVCTQFNDEFIALADPAPAGSMSGNLSFDANASPVSVNIGFVEVCDPASLSNFAINCSLGLGSACPQAPNPYCPKGVNELMGTGFDGAEAGATSWLETTAPVEPGDEFSVRFAIWDAGDQALDSTVLIDGFEWITGGAVSVKTIPY